MNNDYKQIEVKSGPINIPLISLCKKGDVEAVKDFFATHDDIDIDARDEHGKTALMYACEGEYPAIVDFLIEKNAKLDVQDYRGFTALMHACKTDSTDIIDRLIAAGADINIKSNIGLTALIIACDAGKLNAVNALIATHRVDIYATTGMGETALTRACDHNYDKIATALVLCSSKFFGKSILNEKNTPLLWACKNGHIKHALHMLDFEVDPNIPDANGVTPLMAVCEKIDDEDENATIHEVGYYENIELLNRLLFKGAKVDVKDNNGNNTFSFVKNKNVEDLLRVAWKRQRIQAKKDARRAAFKNFKRHFTKPVKSH